MQRKACYLFFLISLAVAANAQSPTSSLDAPSQPPDLRYVLRTADGRTQFRLGEPIEIEELYSSSVPGTYLLLNFPTKVKGGHAGALTFQPSQDVVDLIRDNGDLSAYNILHANCNGGIGSGSGGSCGDCDREYPLGLSPMRFTRVINYQFQFTRPGLYHIRAITANVVLAGQPTDERVPIPLSSTLEIEIVDDPTWSHTQFSESLAAFQQAQSDLRAHGWERLNPYDAPLESSAFRVYAKLRNQVAKAADSLRFLDSEESLSEIIRLYDSSDSPYGPFYSAIVQSRHQALAAELLETRMLEPDFRISPPLVDQLVAMKLRVRFPSAFSSADSNASLYPAARKILHDYILELGQSLAGKEGEALTASAATFRAYAEEDFCTPNPLIPKWLAGRMLKSAGQPVQAPE